MSIDDNQPALPGQTKRIPFKVTRTANYGDGAGSKLERKRDAVISAETWAHASAVGPEKVDEAHGLASDDTEAASMGLDLLSVTHKVVRK